MPRGDYSRALKSLFGRAPVATMDDLRRRLGVASRTTVLSVLGRAGYLSSYTHAGKYYTLSASYKRSPAGGPSCFQTTAIPRPA